MMTTAVIDRYEIWQTPRALKVALVESLHTKLKLYECVSQIVMLIELLLSLLCTHSCYGCYFTHPQL